MTTSHLPVRIVLCLIAAYHLIAGVAAVFFPGAAVKLGSWFFGVNITMTSQAELLVRYLGAFGLSFALLATLAALSPEGNRAILYGFVVYFAVRAFSRIAFWKLLDEHTVGLAPNWFRIIIILAFATSLLAFMPRRQTSATQHG
jgi:hypothetical protein